MSLTLSPARTQLTWPDDFPAGQCQIAVQSEYPDPGPGAPLLRIAVESGPYLISTDKLPDPKRVQEFGHTRQQGMRRFAVTITLQADPGADATADRQGRLSLGNGTDRLELFVAALPVPVMPSRPVAPIVLPAPTLSPVSATPVLTVLTGKSRLGFGTVAPQQEKIETLPLTIQYTVDGRVIPVDQPLPVTVTVPPGGSFAVSTDGTRFGEQVTLPVGVGGGQVLVRYAPTVTGNHTAGLQVSAGGAVAPSPVGLSGTAAVRTAVPAWVPVGAVAVLLLGGGLWWWSQQPKPTGGNTAGSISADTALVRRSDSPQPTPVGQTPPAQTAPPEPVAGNPSAPNPSGTKPKKPRRSTTPRVQPTPGLPENHHPLDPKIEDNGARIIPQSNRQ